MTSRICLFNRHIERIYECIDTLSDKEYSIRELNLALSKAKSFIDNTEKIKSSNYHSDVKQNDLTKRSS